MTILFSLKGYKLIFKILKKLRIIIIAKKVKLSIKISVKNHVRNSIISTFSEKMDENFTFLDFIFYFYNYLFRCFLFI